MLSELEQRQFEEVCLEHIWSALGMHSLSGASSSGSEESSAASSVRELVETAPSYRQCWERVKPIVRTQGFGSFVEVVERRAAAAAEAALLGKHALEFDETTGDEAVRHEGTFAEDRTLAPQPGASSETGSAASQAAHAPAEDSTHEATQSAGDGAATTMQMAKLQILSGMLAGREIQLTKVVTKLGRPGIQVAAITCQADGYHLIHVKGGKPGLFPLVNGTCIGSRARALRDKDVIWIGGIEARFLLG